mmetsp:Transcript_37498/g.89123  ORF Transcript_37498/g.89123 Transcript_37498/m.89123 type:complete len:274 (-) Transcript_37498:165-986(-)
MGTEKSASSWHVEASAGNVQRRSKSRRVEKCDRSEGCDSPGPCHSSAHSGTSEADFRILSRTESATSSLTDMAPGLSEQQLKRKLCEAEDMLQLALQIFADANAAVSKSLEEFEQVWRCPRAHENVRSAHVVASLAQEKVHKARRYMDSLRDRLLLKQQQPSAACCVEAPAAAADPPLCMPELEPDALPRFDPHCGVGGPCVGLTRDDTGSDLSLFFTPDVGGSASGGDYLDIDKLPDWASMFEDFGVGAAATEVDAFADLTDGHEPIEMLKC